jgi:hypothetical protein
MKEANDFLRRMKGRKICHADVETILGLSPRGAERLMKDWRTNGWIAERDKFNAYCNSDCVTIWTVVDAPVKMRGPK